MKVKLNCITRPSVVKQHGTIETYLNPEEYMIYCARISSEDRVNNETAPKLLKYLIDHKHWSPFEMINLGFEVETTRAIGAQILRHRSMSFQEFSQRFAQVGIDMYEKPELRLASVKNRQGSEELANRPDLDEEGEQVLKACFTFYKKLIDAGIATECARFYLPLATKTTIVMQGTLRSWIHYLEQRCSEHAQKEIRLIAFEIRNLLAQVCPWTASALGWNLMNAGLVK